MPNKCKNATITKYDFQTGGITMKKIIFVLLSIFLILSVTGCTSSNKESEEETRSADNKNWPQKSEVAFMEDVPQYNTTADKVTINKTLIGMNSEKETTYSEIVYINYKDASFEEVQEYITVLEEKGYITDKDLSTTLSKNGFVWGSISGEKLNEASDYSLPFIEIVYEPGDDYNFKIKIAIF